MVISKSRNQYKTPSGVYPKRLIRIYHGMKERCRVHPKYQKVGVCKEWLGEYGPTRFYEWAISNGYMEGLSIDRIDNDLGYSPEKCRWIPRILQLKNRGIVNNKGELHHIEVLSSGHFRVTVGSKKNRVRNTFTNMAEAISYRDKKLKEEEEYAWSSYKR